MKRYNSIHPLKIGKGGCNMFENPLHAQFQKAQYALVSEIGAAKLDMPEELLKEWKTNIDLEIEINKETKESTLTAKMREKDRERDRLIRYVFGVIRTQKLSPVKDIREAAEEMAVVFGPYRGMQSNSAETESLLIAGLRVDAEKHSDHVNNLGLAYVLNKLYEVNREFDELRTARRMYLADNRLPSSKKIRPKTDRAFSSVCLYVQMAHLRAASEDEELISTLIRRMNRTSLDFRTSYREGRAQRKRSAEEKIMQNDESAAPIDVPVDDDDSFEVESRNENAGEAIE